MNFIDTPDHVQGTQALADRISAELKAGKRVLWLIPGGSNIPIAIEAMRIIRGSVKKIDIPRLSISLTDERYGSINHPDSNWRQLHDAGIDLDSIKAYPVLVGASLVDTVARFGVTIRDLLGHTDVIIGQFGMGADGHIAGILPHSPAISVTASTAGYESKPFTRVTLTFPILRRIDVACMFLSSAGKEVAIEHLHQDGISLDDQPAQILKELPEAYIYVSP